MWIPKRERTVQRMHKKSERPTTERGWKRYAEGVYTPLAAAILYYELL
jgi:hypothetical protein